MTSLSITHAARHAPDHPAIITSTRTLSFADCAAALVEPPPAVIATPTIDTVLAVYAALEARRPIAMIHHRLTADETARQAAVIADADLPADAAVTLFTSGSTGAARGVVLSHTALVAAARSCSPITTSIDRKSVV